jgi:hypothetical protein
MLLLQREEGFKEKITAIREKELRYLKHYGDI